MAVASAVVDVQDVRVAHLYGRYESAPPRTYFSAVLDLYSAPSPAAVGGEERAQKRRKLDDGNSIGVQSLENFDENKSVVLANVSLELVWMNFIFSS